MLIKLLKMTSSNHDHEALSAMRLANAQVLKLNTDWEDLLNGKVTLIADPFTGVSIPTPAAPSSPSHPYPPQRPSPPRSPPPPVYYKDAVAIQTHFDNLMFATLSPQVQKQLNAIEHNWKANKQLDAADWSQLCGIARAYAINLKPKAKRGGRR